MLSIRGKIFLGCLGLTLVTLLVGLLSQTAQTSLGNTALGLYDNGFVPMSDMRSAQAIVLGVSRDASVAGKGNAVPIDQLQSVLDALDVARERAMSPRGEAAAKDLYAAVSDLQVSFKNLQRPSRQQFEMVEQRFDDAVRIYTSDGFRLRESVVAKLRETRYQTEAAMAASVVTAVFITLVLSRSIVPSIRHAVSIATAIAGGSLDNRIERHGPSETGVLLDALASMQDNIAEKIARIETLMTRQASSHAAEIASQHARFEAALDNMRHGLCMFDPEGRLLVYNQRFIQMFALPEDAGAIARLFQRLDLDNAQPVDAPRDSWRRELSLDDGRAIEMSSEAMSKGGHVVTFEDVTERHQAQARLLHAARHDALTGLPNRVLFREDLEEAVRLTRSEGLLAVLCLDLDRFKTVNDTLGHPVGDALLREAAARLVATTRPADRIARLGGDEFAVIRLSTQEEPPGDQARHLAERLIRVLAEPFRIDGQHIAIGVSIGIAESIAGSASPDTLLKNADLALYLAKAGGRGIYRVFEHEMDARMQARRLLELDLRDAIAGQKFALFYQPLLETATGRVVAFEALLRWHHPQRGFVSPAEFIPLAEETGLITELGLWVIQAACREATAWPPDIKVAVNLSPLQFRCPTLLFDIALALQRFGLPGNRLDVEITESLMLEDGQETLARLHDLRSLGIGISMDDFGTGYSSLSYLRRFPFDKIKIDQSFIRNMVADDDGYAIVEAFVRLGRALRMQVVAEGVETREQLQLLRRAGCQQVQGYLFSRPQPIAQLASLIGDLAVPSFALFGEGEEHHA